MWSWLQEHKFEIDNTISLRPFYMGSYSYLLSNKIFRYVYVYDDNTSWKSTFLSPLSATTLNIGTVASISSSLKKLNKLSDNMSSDTPVSSHIVKI